MRDLHLMGVAVGVDTDDGIDDFCQHGQRPVPFLVRVNVGTGPAWMGSPSGTSVTGHALERTGF